MRLGRPPKKKTKERISASIDNGLRDELFTICHRDRISASDIINKAIREYVKTHKDGNANFTLPQFQDADMLATPALMRDNVIWAKFLSGTRGTKTYNEVIQKMHDILDMCRKQEGVESAR